MITTIDLPGVAITPPRPEDAELLLNFVRTSHTEEGHPLTPAGEAAVRRIAEGEPLARAWIMRLAGRAAGYLVITLGYSIEYEGRDGFIDELYLAPEVRGRGLARETSGRFRAVASYAVGHRHVAS
jgi:GNAT superfamily N-acetyltransferase